MPRLKEDDIVNIPFTTNKPNQTTPTQPKSHILRKLTLKKTPSPCLPHPQTSASTAQAGTSPKTPSNASARANPSSPSATTPPTKPTSPPTPSSTSSPSAAAQTRSTASKA